MSARFFCRIRVTRAIGLACALSFGFTRTVFSQEAPGIITQPAAAQEDQIGSVTSLEVVASGTEPLHYQWCFDVGFDPQLGPLLGRIRGATNATFVPTFLPDEQRYACIVSNSWGSVTSRYALITAPLWVRMRPRGTWQADSPVDQIAYEDHLAYACVSTGAVKVISCVDPNRPRLVGEYATHRPASTVAVENKIAFVACGAAGLDVLDFGDPANPMRRSTLNKAADLVAVQNGIAFLARYEFSGIQLVDVRNVDAPRLAGSLAADYPTSIALNNNRMAAYTGGGVRIADVSDPYAPRWIGFYPDTSYGEVLGLRDDSIYVANSGGSIYILSIANPASPTVVNRFFADWICSLADTMIVTESQSIYDVSTPQQPTRVGFYAPPELRSAFRDGNLLVGAKWDGSGISIVEIESGPPIIESSSSDVDIVIGQQNNAILTVDAHGAGPLKYQWYLGESGDTRKLVGNQEWLVWGLWTSEASSPQHYWVQVTNHLGPINSRTFTVSIRPTLAIQPGATPTFIGLAHPNSFWRLQQSNDLVSWFDSEIVRTETNSTQIALPIEVSNASKSFFRLAPMPKF